ncbi:uncharacterized protein LOC122391856 [Amphibalanus amphitrite]|uniref:uncharacterized protein LOC122391856 n=1 Tax=Amphibalanus amphitrite TaxID=1232801 RepID=UPI001C901532|nr:uncharacterized protein LOC122391856 [Amphibalanus amphitrite]
MLPLGPLSAPGGCPGVLQLTCSVTRLWTTVETSVSLEECGCITSQQDVRTEAPLIDSRDVSPVEARRLFTAEEVCLVLLVLLLWVAAIALFINRWGKIRMLEPCLPYKLATLGAETPMTVQNSRMNSTEEEPATSPSCRRQLSLMTPAGTQLSAPRRVKSAVDLVSLVMAEQLGAAARGGGGAPAAPGACVVPPGPPCAARASHLWQTAARRGGECQIQVPVQVSADSFCSSPGSERAPPTSRARMVRGQWVTRSGSRSISSQNSSKGAETTVV